MKRALALALGLLLCLCACGSMLEREYTVSSPHQEDPPPQTDAAYRVETYPALQSALLSYVEEGLEEGQLRFPTTYAGNLSVDLEKAKRQLMEEEPLGCYALSDLTYRTSKIIAYYEVDLAFTYKVDQTTLTSMPKAVSRGDLSTLMAKALESGEETLCVYLTAYPAEEPDFFDAALADAWAALYGEGETAPATAAPEPPAAQPDRAPAPEPPALTVELYPQTGGGRRVAELTFVPAEIEIKTEAETPEGGGGA